MRISNKKITRENIKIKAPPGDSTIKSHRKVNTTIRKQGTKQGTANLGH